MTNTTTDIIVLQTQFTQLWSKKRIFQPFFQPKMIFDSRATATKCILKTTAHTLNATTHFKEFIFTWNLFTINDWIYLTYNTFGSLKQTDTCHCEAWKPYVNYVQTINILSISRVSIDKVWCRRLDRVSQHSNLVVTVIINKSISVIGGVTKTFSFDNHTENPS